MTSVLLVCLIIVISSVATVKQNLQLHLPPRLVCFATLCIEIHGKSSVKKRRQEKLLLLVDFFSKMIFLVSLAVYTTSFQLFYNLPSL